ncbi:MAG TPA: SMI1/KNR4 family protein [Aggregatilineaceae bacterium]|nr:SMI1/KNR4 family protein [Aggregatilineaceae bacterium]
MVSYDWKTWLKRWNSLLIEKLDPDDYQYYDSSIIQAVHSGWLGFEGCSVEQIEALETRLGSGLPPSYRQFLLASNGFLQPGMLVPRLLSCRDIDWLRVIEKNVFDSWLNWRSEVMAAQRDDDTSLFLQHIESMVVISEKEESGSARYLLRVSADGEWEAYYYAHWLPGARRYDSFWHLMQAQFDYKLAFED